MRMKLIMTKKLLRREQDPDVDEQAASAFHPLALLWGNAKASNKLDFVALPNVRNVYAMFLDYWRCLEILRRRAS